MVRHGTALWATVLLALVCWFALREREQAAQTWSVLQRADPRWLAVVLLVAVGIVAVHGLTYRVLLGRLGHRLPLPPAVGAHLQRVLVGTLSPVGGPPSLYVLVRRLDRHGVPAEDALLAAALRSVAGYGAFVALLAPALLIQPPTREVRWAAVALALGFVVGVAALLRALGGQLAVGGWGCRLPARLQGPLARACGHQVRAGDMVRPFACTLAVKLGGVALLYASLRAVGHEAAPTTALVAYVVGILFFLVAPVFQGIGVVEASMAIALQRLGVPPAAALAAVVLTRGAELWLPLSLALLAQTGTAARATAGPRCRRWIEAAVGAIVPRGPISRPVPVPVRVWRDRGE